MHYIPAKVVIADDQNRQYIPAKAKNMSGTFVMNNDYHLLLDSYPHSLRVLYTNKYGGSTGITLAHTDVGAW